VGDGRMPRIDDTLLDGVAFLYPTVESAQKRERLGGSAFLIGKPIEATKEVFGKVTYAPYLVSNRHVVFEGSAVVATINKRDGGEPYVVDIDQEAWVAHPEGDDVAATSVMGRFDRVLHKVSFIKVDAFFTRERAAEMALGVGDEVFMVGRFVNLQGVDVNRPAARFGSISAGPIMIPTRGPGGVIREQESYAVEMRSRTGFSGSPVCAYRTLATTLTNVPEGAKDFWGLLGVNWGYVRDEEGENTWLNGVVPAWKILDILNTPRLLEVHEAIEQFTRDNANALRDQMTP